MGGGRSELTLDPPGDASLDQGSDTHNGPESAFHRRETLATCGFRTVHR